MSGGHPKNAALATALAFHYQVLIGMNQSFLLQDGQSIWFEKDGDISITGQDLSQAKQTEVKKYAGTLTDNHINLWNTLKNWLASEFQHEGYGALVLYSTQSFGSTTKLKDWNVQSTDQRLQTLQEIYAERKPEEINAKEPSEIVKLQKAVMDSDISPLKCILAKVILHLEADNEGELRKKFFLSLDGSIPKSNQQAYAEALIGFIYEKATPNSWVITKMEFDQKREALTAQFRPRLFTIPSFELRDATQEELDTHSDALFVQKIHAIQYADALPEAVGNWLELHNSLREELHGYPQFRNTAARYQDQLTRNFKRKYATISRKTGDVISRSKDLYDEVINEQPFGIEGYENPDYVFKNGLIHDAMDSEGKNLQWRVNNDELS